MSALTLVKLSYFVAATLFLLGLQRMASPKTARSGIQWAGVGMLIATVATFFLPGLHNIGLMIAAIVIGVGLNWLWGKKVAITDMPQMVALFNGMGGGSAAAIGAVELVRYSGGEAAVPSTFTLSLAVTGALIGAVSLTGSVIAWAKLDGRMDKRYTFPGQQWFNALVALAAIVCGVMALTTLAMPWIIAFFVLSLALGVLMTLPIGGADMPVVISLYNAFTGLAVAFEGYVLGNEALIIAGTMVGAAGMLLTRLMAKAMNRKISNVLFSNFGGGSAAMQEIGGSMKPIEAADVAAMMAYAERVVIVPGYGLAVAQAQHKIWELSQKLMDRGVKVKFAIHPVAGRMPGHMNVLLAEAGVPYDLIADMDDINPEFANTDVSLVIGANDVVNPVAKTDPASPIYGMPILDVVNSKNTIVIKRGKGTGFAGIENALFYADNTRMLYGDGSEMANALVSELKALDGGH
ncbi:MULTISPECIES: NAD(P)(+) transhydrogenase (Re/Si-specific) subunit beta [Pseudoxanthomonas]|uniref:NAD(P) transhydrogenase subunit beta n=1 Tax=Pseudoxanthomonas japonensis TaxID=69284 RepID=A0ABQ6ZEP3_9GAMM|nr:MULTISPECIES: NAD(P)(+) transhydrogenase (Re/Si-specific) subunit beta [Pseudoxanthomonas]KAF1723923.1 NAD(P) transhydrogenase subunit beta [Pseudoxanthomonas japonensis]PZQ27174.1 MAG: NAD(P) transhydrogenase subunit beta [Stenotrophomonas acidaminiphila]